MSKCLAMVLVAALCACAGNEPSAPKSDEALIVFIVPGMYSSSGGYQPTYGTVFSISLHEVTGPERKLVGILALGQKFAYRVRPGKHQFMLISRGSTDFMEANVDPGKTYHAVVDPQVSSRWSYEQRYAFRPVRPVDFENGLFNRWQTGTSFVDRSEAWGEWDTENAEANESRRRRFWDGWAKKSADQRAPRTLQRSDGR